MAKSRKALREEVKAMYVEALAAHYVENGEEVLRVKSNEIAFPVTDAEGNEDFIVITVKIPTGAAKGTEPYDGYAMAQEYEMSRSRRLPRQRKQLRRRLQRLRGTLKGAPRKLRSTLNRI